MKAQTDRRSQTARGCVRLKKCLQSSATTHQRNASPIAGSRSTEAKDQKMNTQNPTRQFEYRRVEAYKGRHVFATYSTESGNYLCRVFAIQGKGWTHGDREFHRTRDKAVNAFLRMNGRQFKRAGDLIGDALKTMRQQGGRR